MTATKKTLLIVDDEADLLAELQPMLARSGYQVLTAANGEEALALIATATPDLIILDLLMPKLDGRATLRRLRQQENWVPVILLTQINTPLERVMSLQEGADDYLNKPFDPLELLARIQAILRRVERATPSTVTAQILTSGALRVDRQARKVLHNGATVELTMRAFDLLVYLMRNAQEAIGRDRLLDEVWGWSYAVSTRAVDIRIAEIRKALGDDAEAPLYIEPSPALATALSSVYGRSKDADSSPPCPFALALGRCRCGVGDRGVATRFSVHDNSSF